MNNSWGFTKPLTKALATVAIGLLACSTFMAHAQTPSGKPTRLIVGQPAGGGTDSIARILGQSMAEHLGQPIVVDNRPGAGGTIGNQAAATSAPDGLNIMLGEISALSISPTLYPETVNPQKAFEPIGLVASNTFVIVASPQSGFKTLADMIAAAKAKPNQVNYATPGNGTLQHLAAELLKSQAGIAMQHIPYKGGAPATLSVLSNETSVALIGVPPLLSYIAAGKLIPLAVGSNKRVKELPNVPTLAESGFKDFDANIWYGLVAPKGTPKEVLTRLNAAAQKAVADPVVLKGFAKAGVEPMTSSPEQFSSVIQRERVKWAAVIKAAGVKVD